MMGVTAAAFVFWLSVVSAYITHLIWSISLLVSDAALNTAVGKIVLAVLGVIVPPIGVIHGVMVWFGIGG